MAGLSKEEYQTPSKALDGPLLIKPAPAAKTIAQAIRENEESERRDRILSNTPYSPPAFPPIRLNAVCFAKDFQLQDLFPGAKREEQSTGSSALRYA